MKKLICLMLCTMALIGCGSADNTENKAQTTTIATTAPVENCNWVDNSHTYATEADFLAEGVAKMGFYNSETMEKMPITPYTVEYDEEKYELSQIACVAEYEYFYFFRNKETREKVRVSFFYADSIATVNDVHNAEKYQQTTINFNGNSNTQALLKSTDETNSLTLVPCDNCSMTITSYASSEAAVASADVCNNSALDLLNDFTISEA